MYKGEIEGFPQEVVEKMLYYQEQQGYKRDVTVFEKDKRSGNIYKGFIWYNTPEGVSFWNKIIQQRNFQVFFEKYPKTTYPKVMMVSNEPITAKNPGAPRVVFMEKNGHYIAWLDAKTLKHAEDEYLSMPWKYAKDIITPTIVELTFKDISEGKGVGIDPSLIRIKECK